MTRAYTGTNGNDTWTVVQAATFSLNGLGGVDTINFGTSRRADYTIVANADGSVSVDTVSGASAALHATLYNVELLTFNDGTDILDLRTYFGDSVAPVLISTTLTSAGAALPVDASFSFTFDETVKLGSGTIVLRGSGGEVVETFDAAHGAGVSISGNTVTIDPSANLLSGTGYRLDIGAGALVDLAGNAFKGVADIRFATMPAAVLLGTAGNDTLQAGPGSVAIDAGAGTDTVVYAMPYASATVTRSGNALVVSKPGGSDVLTGVERLAFADKAIAWDIDGVGGQAYRLYQAAFNRAPDAGGIGFWMAQMDKGLSLQGLAASFFASPEFQALVGASPSNGTILEKFYQNVLHRSPDAGGFAFWVDILDRAAATPAQVLAAFSESPENQAALIGTISNGFVFIPYTG